MVAVKNAVKIEPKRQKRVIEKCESESNDRPEINLRGRRYHIVRQSKCDKKMKNERIIVSISKSGKCSVFQSFSEPNICLCDNNISAGSNTPGLRDV